MLSGKQRTYFFLCRNKYENQRNKYFVERNNDNLHRKVFCLQRIKYSFDRKRRYLVAVKIESYSGKNLVLQRTVCGTYLRYIFRIAQSLLLLAVKTSRLVDISSSYSSKNQGLQRIQKTVDRIRDSLIAQHIYGVLMPYRGRTRF